MNVFRYETPNKVVRETKGPSIFLAGPTVRGHQTHLTSWRFAAIEEFEKLGFEGNLIVPEFTVRTESDKGKPWVPLWEYNGLKRADCIMFWIPRTKELIGLTTNYELAMWSSISDKVIYGRPDDAYRIDYIDLMWNVIQLDEYLTGDEKDIDISKYDNPPTPIYNTLHDTIRASIQMAQFHNDVREE